MLRSQWTYGSNFYINGKQFDVLSNDIENTKKYEFLVQNQEKNLKIRFFDNFARFGKNTRLDFFGASDIDD